jgi:hypothetical protein
LDLFGIERGVLEGIRAKRPRAGIGFWGADFIALSLEPRMLLGNI